MTLDYNTFRNRYENNRINKCVLPIIEQNALFFCSRKQHQILILMGGVQMHPGGVHHYEYLVPIFVETAVMKCFSFSEGRFA